MSVEVLLGFVVENFSRYPYEVKQVPRTGQLHLVINHGGRGLCGFVHVKLNTREKVAWSSATLPHCSKIPDIVFWFQS